MSFFFSSRRRHTRFDCDWSSDVCSSDLAGQIMNAVIGSPRYLNCSRGRLRKLKNILPWRKSGDARGGDAVEIGRGAWWGRGEILVVGRLFKKKKKNIDRAAEREKNTRSL